MGSINSIFGTATTISSQFMVASLLGQFLDNMLAPNLLSAKGNKILGYFLAALEIGLVAIVGIEILTYFGTWRGSAITDANTWFFYNMVVLFTPNAIAALRTGVFSAKKTITDSGTTTQPITPPPPPTGESCCDDCENGKTCTG